MFKKAQYDETAESCIEILSGTHPTHSYTGTGTNNSDKSLLLSLAKQTYKGTPYTDRQFDLVKQKINLYRQILIDVGVDVDRAKDNLRFPLRSIDRSRWIGIRNVEDTDYIAVRFSFNKKLISFIDQLRSKEHTKLYDEKEKIHYFPFNESNVYKIISMLKEKNFNIESDLEKIYEKVQMMQNNKKDYIPGIYGFKLKNLNDKAVEYIVSDVGKEPNADNLALYKDRDALYGIEHFDEEDLNESVKNLTTLSQKIVRRKCPNVLIDSDVFTVNNIVETVLELNRFPVLVCLQPQTDFDDLSHIYKCFKNIFSNDDFCVLYRKDNNTAENKYFNQFIKLNGLNNSLANNSKIVYTTQDKVTKTLLKNNWKPKSALVFGCSRTNKMETYLNELDLVMYYDTDISPFLRNIEKI
tara:strand:+ start:9294 stop:10526 length:1233 start_codon:yes stop_codon:yes gene_type:complete